MSSQRGGAADFDRALARLPRWLLVLGALGTAAEFAWTGVGAAGGFLLGAIAAYLNLWLVERAVDRIARLAGEPDARVGRGSGVRLSIQFGALVLVAFVIIEFSGFNRTAAVWGFLCCPAAAVLEILYELVVLKR